jgi:hypothetical protein
MHFALGELALGFNWLAKAYQDRCFELIVNNVDFRFDALRGDSRFTALAAQLGVTEATSAGRREQSPWAALRRAHLRKYRGEALASVPHSAPASFAIVAAQSDAIGPKHFSGSGSCPGVSFCNPGTFLGRPNRRSR